MIIWSNQLDGKVNHNVGIIIKVKLYSSRGVIYTPGPYQVEGYVV
jgi:hypothetical protein